MIALLTGLVVSSDVNSVVLDVKGVGYLVFVPTSVLSRPPQADANLTLWTHLVTRGQPDFEMTLYGFLEAMEQKVFRLLISISGVGPKVGLALLSHLSVEELSRALSTNDTRLLATTPGVGPKMAQKLCLELGDKMAEFAFSQRTERKEAGKQTAQTNEAYEDAVEALVGLGYGRGDARRAAEMALGQVPDPSNASALITKGLSLLNAKR